MKPLQRRVIGNTDFSGPKIWVVKFDTRVIFSVVMVSLFNTGDLKGLREFSEAARDEVRIFEETLRHFRPHPVSNVPFDLPFLRRPCQVLRSG